MGESRTKPRRKPSANGRGRKKDEPEPASGRQIPVKYSNVNIGDKTGRIGLSVHRGNMTVAEADRTLCDKRLHVRLLARPEGSQAEQEGLPGLEADVELEAVCDVKGYGVTSRSISFGLTFMLKSIDLTLVPQFAKHEGMLTILAAGEIPEDSPAQDEEEEEEPEEDDEE
jgi:hypothetical protein